MPVPDPKLDKEGRSTDGSDPAKLDLEGGIASGSAPAKLDREGRSSDGSASAKLDREGRSSDDSVPVKLDKDGVNELFEWLDAVPWLGKVELKGLDAIASLGINGRITLLVLE